MITLTKKQTTKKQKSLLGENCFIKKSLLLRMVFSKAKSQKPNNNQQKSNHKKRGYPRKNILFV